MPRFKTILCPVDFDQGALPLLRLAADLAAERQAVLHVIHVVAVPPSPEVPLSFAAMEASAHERLARLGRQGIGARVPYEIHVRTGDPSAEVLFAAKQLGAELIVMATHGRKGLRRLVMGSVAERVVREAPCPVLTIRPGVFRARRPRRPATRREHSRPRRSAR